MHLLQLINTVVYYALSQLIYKRIEENNHCYLFLVFDLVFESSLPRRRKRLMSKLYLFHFVS